MKTFIGLVIVAIAVAVGGVWYVNGRPPERPQFRTLEITRDELLISVSATGTVAPVEEIDVGAQIVGRIREFGPDPHQPSESIDYGSHVKKGAVLARIDDSNYVAEVDKARASLKVAQAESLRSKAQLEQAAADFKRAESLRNINSESDYDRAVAQFSMAKAEASVSQARVEQAEIMLKQAENNLTYTTIESPIDGIVIDRRVNVGQTVVAGLNAPSLFLLARDLSRLQVWAAVNEADIGDIRLQQKVTFRVDAYRDQKFHGTVSQIRLNAGKSNNVVTYGVVVDIDNRDGALLPYMTANLQFEVARKSDVLLVPVQALRWQPQWNEVTPAVRSQFAQPGDGKKGDTELLELDEPMLWVRDVDGLVRPLQVQTGLSDGMVTEVTGDEIVEGLEVVVGRARKAKKDFVSSFVSRVTGKGNE